MKLYLFTVSCFLLVGKSLASINSSVLLFHEWDLNRCVRQLRKAKELGNKKIQIIPTLHYSHNDRDQLQQFYYKDNKGKVEVLNGKSFKSFVEKLTNCLGFAKNSGLQVLITPHLDTVDSSSGHWRNNLVFDPLQKFGGYSYKEVMLDPIVNMINDLGLSGKLSLQGEMGATVFAFPESYQSIVTDYKSQFPSIPMGICLNYNQLSGRFKASSTQNSLVEALLNEVDFIGFSNYFSVSRPISQSTFRDHVRRFLVGLESYSITLDPDQEIIFSEVGLGGGELNILSSENSVLASPHLGTTGRYHSSRDPWKRYGSLRKDYYRALIDFSKSDYSKYNVSEIYLWNADSWDVQGLYPGHSRYKDDEITEWILGTQ